MFEEFFLGGLWFSWIFRIAVILLIVWVIVHGSNRNQKNNNNQRVRDTPLDIIKRRYANGEITKEEFEIMKKDLRA